ncbi:MAG TPA: HEAT repeat domain-containing protein [Thermoanaerobaculia bacterium]
MKKPALLLFMALCLALPVLGDEPFVRNHGNITRVAASANLRAQLDGARDGWIGYALPLAESRSIICRNYNEWIGEDEEGRTNVVQLFFHVENGRIENLKIAAPLCVLDAKKEAVTWISGVEERAAVTTLIDVARRHGDSDIRQKALFWLSQQAGAKAVAALENAVDNDPEEKVKVRAVFGLSQLPDDQSIPILVRLMKTHRIPEVRKKAAFWLGQKNDPRALAAIEDVLLH